MSFEKAAEFLVTVGPLELIVGLECVAVHSEVVCILYHKLLEHVLAVGGAVIIKLLERLHDLLNYLFCHFKLINYKMS